MAWAVPDFSRLGDSLGEALAKAKDDMEKAVDSTLGISTKTVEADLEPQAGAAPLGSTITAVRTAQAGPANPSADGDAATPTSGRTVTKKVIKKVIRKVVVRSDASKAGATDGPTGEAPSVDDAAASAVRDVVARPATPSLDADGNVAAPPQPTTPGQEEAPDLLPAAGGEAAQQQPPTPSCTAMTEGPAECAPSMPAAHTDSDMAVLAGLQHVAAPSPDAADSGTGTPKAGDGACSNGPAAAALHAPGAWLPLAASQPQLLAHSDSANARKGDGHLGPRSISDDEASLVSTTAAAAAPAPLLPAAAPPNTDAMDVAQLRELVVQMQEGMQARDGQLIKQAQQLADVHQMVSQLQEKNEQLALRSASLSEADYESVRAEFEQRLAAAERKVYAIAKERDALRKGAEKLTEYTNLIKEKDDMIKQVMEEGERLSRKQVDLEAIIKKVRQQLAQAEAERDKLASKLAAEEAAGADLRKAKAKLERDLAAAAEQAKADLEGQREHYELLLQKAKSDQVDAEERARDAASQGLARRVREAEARSEALAESCSELRDALDRQRQAADLREEMLKADLSDLERRCQAAELRHQDLAAKLPEATRPLLRQIEAMQAASEAQAEAWAGAEGALHARVGDAEARAASAAERERLAADRLQALLAKVASLEGSLAASRNEVRSLNEQVEVAQSSARQAKEAASSSVQQAELLQERSRMLQQQCSELEASLLEAQDAERSARQAMEHDVSSLRREYERRLSDMGEELAASRLGGGGSESGRAPEPPAMAAPGYRWVLLREGEQQAMSSGAQPHGLAREPSSSKRSLEAFASGGGMLSGIMSNPSVSGPAAASSMVLASELENLRGELRQKTGEVAALEHHVRELQATRDRLAEELVAGAAKAEEAREMVQRVQRIEAELDEARSRYSAAVELVGERDEALEELRADLLDVKQLYKDQIEFMCQQLAELQAQAYKARTASVAVPHENGVPAQ